MAFTKKTVRDADVDGKRVLMRVDFNVPLKDGFVTDDTRVRAAIPTIQYLKEHNAKIILMSHLGRPDGTGFQPELSLCPAAEKLAELTGYEVKFVEDTYGEKAAEAVARPRAGRHPRSRERPLRQAREEERSRDRQDPRFLRRHLRPRRLRHRPPCPGLRRGPRRLPARLRRLPAREGGRHPDRHLRRA